VEEALREYLLSVFMMFIVLMPFFAVREFGRVVGENELYELFFVRRSELYAEVGDGMKG
jgi:hypothetical protein